MFYSIVDVQNVITEVLSISSVRVSWDNSSIQDITEFVVYYRQTGNRNVQNEEMSVVVAASANSVIITNLVSEVEYVFEVVVRVTIGDKSVSGNRVGSNPLKITTANLMTPTQNGFQVLSHGLCEFCWYMLKFEI